MAIGKSNDFRGRFGHRLVVIPHNVANQHHLGQGATLTLGGVAHCTQITLIQVLQACQQCATGLLVQEVFDLHNRRDSILGIAKEFQADRADMVGHAMQDPTGTGDQTIATFFLDAGQAA